MRIYYCFTFLSLFVLKLAAQSDSVDVKLSRMVISTQKTPIDANASVKPVQIITAEEIAAIPGQSLTEIINTKAGIEITGARGFAGQNLGYAIRGSRNRQVLILIDGVAVNDPSQIANDFDLRLVDAAQIERVEIIKGPSSVLYGSNAAAAVINIILKKSDKDFTRLELFSLVFTSTSAEDKDYEPAGVKSGVVLNTKNTKGLGLRFSAAQEYVDGLSAAEALDNSPLDSDRFFKWNALVGLDYSPENQSFNASSSLGVDAFESTFDNFAFSDANNLIRSKSVRWLNQFQYKFHNNSSINFKSASTWSERKLDDDFPGRFEAFSQSIDVFYEKNYTWNKLKGQTLIGTNALISSFLGDQIDFMSGALVRNINRSEANFNIVDPYLHQVINYENLQLETGLRWNIHSEYGSHFLYQIAPAYTLWKNDLKQLRAYAGYSTAFITPSLFQLFDSQFGNPDLEPEEDESFETGLRYISKLISVNAIFFNRTEKEFIDFVLVDPNNFGFQYRNIDGTFKARGFELEAQLKLPNAEWSVNYSFTERNSEQELLRIPKHKVNASLVQQISKRFSTGIYYQYVHDRTDLFFDPIDFSSSTVRLKAYDLWKLSFNYAIINNKLQAQAFIDNVFNKNFEELRGFQTLGRNFRIGLRYTML